jgi:hypothetical protein
MIPAVLKSGLFTLAITTASFAVVLRGTDITDPIFNFSEEIYVNPGALE